MEFKFTKTRKVKSPSRGTSLSAGIDFFIPEFDDKFIEDLKSKNKNITFGFTCGTLQPDLTIPDNKTTGFILFAHQRILVPLGVHVKIPKDYCMIFFNKGGISNKKGLDVLACVVDEDYQGEVFLSLVNTSDNEIAHIEAGDKIIQGVLLPTIYTEINEVSILEELYKEKTERGEGGFGSTGHK